MPQVLAVAVVLFLVGQNIKELWILENEKKNIRKISAHTTHIILQNKRALKIMNSLFAARPDGRAQANKSVHETVRIIFARAFFALAVHVLLQLLCDFIQKRKIHFVHVCGCKHPKIAYNIPFHFIAFFSRSLVLWWWCTTVRDLQKEEFYACCTDTILQQPFALSGLCFWVWGTFVSF